MKIGNLEVYGIIYKIENLVNGKVYIGQTTQDGGFNKRYHFSGCDIERVYNYHLNKNKYNEGYNGYLLNSIKKYGFDTFKVAKIFDIAFSKEELDIKEQIWIRIYDSTNKEHGYNFDEGGARGKRSERTKEKLRQSNLGKVSKKRQKVVCLNENIIFDSLTEAGEYYNTRRQHIASVCKNKALFSGKLYKNDKIEKLVWVYYEDYINMSFEEIQYKIDRVNNDKKYFGNKTKNFVKKIICITTNKIFKSLSEANKYYNCSRHICDCCKGRRKYCGQLEDGTKLQWMYYDDYVEKLNNNEVTLHN